MNSLFIEKKSKFSIYTIKIIACAPIRYYEQTWYSYVRLYEKTIISSKIFSYLLIVAKYLNALLTQNC